MTTRFIITLTASLFALCLQAFAGVEGSADLLGDSWFDGR